jgi:hypothetical protein
MNGGIFWTRPIPRTSVKVNPGRGHSSLTLSDVTLFDFVTGLNAIFRDGSAPIADATASIEIRWKGTGERLQVQNAPAGFGGSYEHATATVEWSASNTAGYFFSTANSSDISVTHAFTARIRNGVFHPRR